MRVARMQRNAEHKGIEILFDHVPADSARENLKGHGFKWNRKTKVWYIRYTKKNEQTAVEFLTAYNSGSFTGPLYVKREREIDPERQGLIEKAISIMNSQDPENRSENERYAKRATNNQLKQIIAYA